MAIAADGRSPIVMATPDRESQKRLRPVRKVSYEEEQQGWKVVALVGSHPSASKVLCLPS